MTTFSLTKDLEKCWLSFHLLHKLVRHERGLCRLWTTRIRRLVRQLVTVSTMHEEMRGKREKVHSISFLDSRCCLTRTSEEVVAHDEGTGILFWLDRLSKQWEHRHGPLRSTFSRTQRGTCGAQKGLTGREGF